MSTATNWIDSVTMDQLNEDPHPVHDRLREQAPVAFVPAVGLHVASTREACLTIAQDSENWATVIAPAGERSFGKGTVLAANDSEHAELRKMIDPGLRPSAVDGHIDDLVRPYARHLLGELDSRGKADIQEEYFAPVSVRAVGDLMGLTNVPAETLVRWFQTLALAFGNAAVDESGDFLNKQLFEAADAVRAEIHTVVDPLLDHWAENPDHSLLSHWLHDGGPEGELQSRDKIYPNIYVFLLGALQEPGHVMTTTLAALLRDPEQLERVVDDPTLIPRAANEAARWVAPIWTAATKVAKNDVTVSGVEIAAGTTVLLSYGSANRDSATWERAEVFDLDRPAMPNLAFGAGQHACAGTHVGMSIVRIALEELFDAIPNIEADPDQDVTFWGWTFRGPQGLHVQWEV
ncbi:MULTISPECIES: cytochrome P450 [unclassified Dietzia]|uniref:cytochrome P450 n=1 Tax=unclassified Dietzia TaxID=2617939 RepID=UPI000D22B575|nr:MULTISPECIES: cytochrome P450 [unclassified Dietzia]AVZ38415.1 cytochrome P450 [Dietzia sp. JS16-p6b]QGW23445.1 cytochrome P450 [Dietzia sp. DQ12-45-1b]